MENYKEKMKRKVNDAKLRHESNQPKNNDLGNALIAIISIVGFIFAIVTIFFIVCKLLV